VVPIEAIASNAILVAVPLTEESTPIDVPPTESAEALRPNVCPLDAFDLPTSNPLDGPPAAATLDWLTIL